MSGFDGAEVIFTYTSEQAVEDGILVEVPEDIRREHAVKVPAFVTTNLYREHVEIRPFLNLMDERNAARLTHLNLSILVRAARRAFLAGDPDDLMRTNIRYGKVEVWAVIDGAGLTVMLPSDY